MNILKQLVKTVNDKVTVKTLLVRKPTVFIGILQQQLRMLKNLNLETNVVYQMIIKNFC